MILRRLSCGLAAGAVAVVIGSGAFAQTSLDEPPLDQRAAARLDRMEKVVRELRAIVFQGRETGQPVVIQPAETQGQINQLSDRFNDLDHTLTRLNGEMEVIRHDLDQSRQDANDLRAQNGALKEQITVLEQKVLAITAPPPPPPPAAGDPGGAASAASAPVPTQDPAGAFAAAKAMFQAGDSAGAEAAFHDFVDRFGDAPRGQEARYYLAKTLIARKAWPEAATADIGAIRGWPQTRWAPDAVLDLSRALVGIGKTPDACATLDELARHYPQSPPAVKTGARAVRETAGCR